MKFSVKLLIGQRATAEGYPVVARVNHKVNGKSMPADKFICKAFPDQFDVESQNVNLRHPDYDVVSPMIMSYHLRARKLRYSKFSSAADFLEAVVSRSWDDVGLMEAWDEVTADMQRMMESLERNGSKREADRMKGNLKVYRNVRAQFERFAAHTGLGELDQALLLRFKNYQLGIGNSKSTVHNYLRTIRAVWKKAAVRYKVPASNPFEGVFAGLTVKSYASKKKYIDREAVRQLETAPVAAHEQKYVDLWLLQFYFGGADLIDLYNLYQRSLRKGRVYFERQKTGTGLPINLKVHPKALELLQRYTTGKDEWLFPWAKDKAAYESFRAASNKVLKKVQLDLGIEVLPNGGNLAGKVARHTFATLAKQLLMPEDILRELMGHERDDVDNYYKAQYPEAVRDEWLFRVIEGD